MEVSGKKILIMGAARSGVAASKFLSGHGAQVILTDVKPVDAMQNVQKEVEVLGIETIWGEQPNIKKINPDFIVVKIGRASWRETV